MKEKDILYQNGEYWACISPRGHAYGFEVYKDGITHATRVSQIGYTGIEGLKRARAECDRRESDDIKNRKDGPL